MAKPVVEREKGKPTAKVKRNAALSMRARAKRPIPATRREADELFGPGPAYSLKPASGPRLARMVQLGIIPTYTNAEAHALILDAMYDEQGLLRVDPTIHTVRATPDA